MRKILFLLLTLSIFSPFDSYTQDEQVDQFERVKLVRLKRLRSEMIRLESSIFLIKKNLETEEDMVNKLKYESELMTKNRKYQKKKLLFIETATGVNITSEDGVKAQRDFLKELQNIFHPMLDGIRKISERPRKIQKLKDKIVDIEQKVSTAKVALEKLEKLKAENKHKELVRSYRKSIKFIKENLKKLKIEKEDLHFKQLKLEQSHGSTFQEFSKIIFGFFRTKGKNLFLSLFAFIILFWAFQLSKKRVITVLMFRVNNGANREQLAWIARPINVIYSVFSFILSLAASLMTLYILNDWVLVTFIVVLIGALIWSSRQYFPIFFEQSKIVLNLGAIREGERIIYQGLPWQIKSLGYYCRLVNPALSGGTLRINTRELLSHNSRPINEKEPWFPTRINDWVELSDGTYGKVTLQSPEQVSVRLVGEELKFLPTEDFLEQKPVNLSNGFCVDMSFGLDYKHQKNINQVIIPKIKEELKKRLYQDFSDKTQSFKEIAVDFKCANASSLDLRIFLRCQGNLASQKLLLERRVQSILIDVCNENEYVIPFNQLTVHMHNE